MQEYTDEQIREKYNNLPEDLKKAIFGVETAGILKIIGEKYQLYLDKIGVLGNETGLVMLGITHPNNFISNLAERLKIDKETARKIGEEVNNQIFAKVRESLKKIHGIVPPPPQPPPPLPQPTPRPQPTPPPLPPSPLTPLPKGEGVPTVSGVGTGEVKKEEILKEIEKEEAVFSAEKTANPFEAKTKEGVLKMPLEVKKYSGPDPYHEPIK
jgi:hypothetical protein